MARLGNGFLLLDGLSWILLLRRVFFWVVHISKVGMTA
jgi:hypothetical protein